MKKNLLLAFAFALAATFAIAQESSTSKDPAQQSDPAAQTKPDDKSTTPAQDSTGAQSANKESSTKEAEDTSSKNKADKNAISQQLHDKFASDPALSNVKFHVNKAVVTLTGKVDSADEVARAKELAMSVDGVKSVRNRLKVASSSAAAAGPDTHANSEAKNTTPDVDKNAAGEQGINPTASGSPAKDASGTNTATSTGGNTSTTPTTTASGNTAPSAAGSIAGNTSAASGTQTSSGSTSPSGSSSLPASDQSSSAASTPQSSASGDSATLQSTIQDKLKNEPLLSSSSVNVNVTESAIELSGTVATGKEKQTAERIAQSYAGNRKVVDRITVTGNGNGSSGQAAPVQPNGSVPTSANPSTPNGTPPTNQTPPTPEQSTQPK
jgi:osmotically-inducible protein OsmY